MPLVPTGAGSPYPVVEDILRTARQMVNDMWNDFDGDLLTDGEPGTQTALTNGWRWLQAKCAGASIEVNTDEVTLYGIPARASTDVSKQCWVNWQQCSDGVYLYNTPVLPQTIIQPLSIWRRQSGVNATNFSWQMTQAKDGLSRDCFATNEYDWRANALYFYGETYPQDLLIRASLYLPDLVATNPAMAVGIRDCNETLGARVAFYFTNARVPGGAGATSLMQLSESAFQESFASRTSKRKQRQTVVRRGFSNRRLGYNRFPYTISGGF